MGDRQHSYDIGEAETLGSGCERWRVCSSFGNGSRLLVPSGVRLGLSGESMNEFLGSSSMGLTMWSRDAEAGDWLKGGLDASWSGVKGDTRSSLSWDCPPMDIRGRRWMIASSVLRESIFSVRL